MDAVTKIQQESKTISALSLKTIGDGNVDGHGVMLMMMQS
jgi:hypothetical protein